MCCLLIYVGEMDPISALGGISNCHRNQTDKTVETGQDFLHPLVNLFKAKKRLSNSDSVSLADPVTADALRSMAEQHYQSRSAGSPM